MAELLGSPMIRHVYENTVLNPLVDLTVVATCDEEIAEYVVSIGGRAVMTSNEHVRATDRCAEAVVIVEEEDGVRFDIVVMVQGDEPMTHPGMITEAVERERIDEVVDAMAQRMAKAATLAVKWTKSSINAGLKVTANAIIDRAAAYENLSMLTQDHRIAVDAFRTRSKPEFTGR